MIIIAIIVLSIIVIITGLTDDGSHYIAHIAMVNLFMIVTVIIIIIHIIVIITLIIITVIIIISIIVIITGLTDDGSDYIGAQQNTRVVIA